MKPREDAIHLAAQCWCDEETSHKEMDATLAMAFAKRLEVLMQERDSLKAQVEELKKQLDGCRIVFLESAKENDSLKAQLEIAVKALEYYGSISLGESGAWCFRKKFCFDLVQTEDMQFLLEPIGKNGEKYAIGGKLARQALTQIKELQDIPSGISDREDSK